MKAAAPQALLPQNIAKGKKSGKTAGVSGRTLAPGKAGRFHGLMAALAAAKGGKAAADPDIEALKKSLVAALKKSRPTDPSAEVKASKADAGTARDAVAVDKHDKQDTRRKMPAANILLAGLVLPTGTPSATKRPVDQATGASGKDPAGAQPVSVAAHRAVKNAEPVVHIVDLRRKNAAVKTEDGAAQVKPAQLSTGDKDPGASFAQRLGQAADARPEAAPKASSAPMASQQTPIERLKEMAGSELLKASNLILRDGGGEIKLVLKPESLGSVRIRMNLVDNAIEGRIIVDNTAVKHIVEGNIDALRNALQQQGFQAGALSVSVGGQGTDDGRREQEKPAEVRRIAAQGFERSMPAADDAGMSDLLVNLFV